MHEAGILNTVGTLGEFGDNKIDMLKKYGQFNIIVATDSDEAGDRDFQQIKDSLDLFALVRRLEIPKGEDPASISREERVKLYQELVGGA
jgi:DNA primase